jgi:hypothetical protein
MQMEASKELKKEKQSLQFLSPANGTPFQVSKTPNKGSEEKV